MSDFNCHIDMMTANEQIEKLKIEKNITIKRIEQIEITIRDLKKRYPDLNIPGTPLVSNGTLPMRMDFDEKINKFQISGINGDTTFTECSFKLIDRYASSVERILEEVLDQIKEWI